MVVGSLPRGTFPDWKNRRSRARCRSPEGALDSCFPDSADSKREAGFGDRRDIQKWMACTMPKRGEPHAQCSPTKDTSHARSVITEFLRCKENLACVRIFYFGSRWKPSDVDITAIWRERTGNPAWFAGHGSSIRQFSFLLARA